RHDRRVQSPGHIASIAVRSVLDGLRAIGAEPAQVLRPLGVASALAEGDERWLPHAMSDALWRVACERMGPMLPLQLAEHLPHERCGHLGAMAVRASTTGAALGRLARYYGLLSKATRYHVQPHGAAVLVRTELFGRRPPGVEVFAVGRTLALLRREAIGEVTAREVWLTQPRGSAKQAVAYEQGFAAPVRYGQAIAGYLLEPGALDRPMRRADPLVGDLLERYAECSMIAATHTPLAARVRSELAVRPPDELAAPTIARALGISERAMRRGLQAEGTSLRDEQGAVLRERAIAALQHRSVEQVAAELGYADAAAFRRAFRRWCGVSPGEYARSAAPITGTRRARAG
ncbi:MAG TPA: AraC family transcriptional regulator ligand-binding domain-containing protein, partial [Nannocystis sp.]